MTFYKFEFIPMLGIGWFTDTITNLNGKKFRVRSFVFLYFRFAFIDKKYLN